jgi:hypothetical protein
VDLGFLRISKDDAVCVLAVGSLQGILLDFERKSETDDGNIAEEKFLADSKFRSFFGGSPRARGKDAVRLLYRV